MSGVPAANRRCSAAILGLVACLGLIGGALSSRLLTTQVARVEEAAPYRALLTGETPAETTMLRRLSQQEAACVAEGQRRAREAERIAAAVGLPVDVVERYLDEITRRYVQ